MILLPAEAIILYIRQQVIFCIQDTPPHDGF